MDTSKIFAVVGMVMSVLFITLSLFLIKGRFLIIPSTEYDHILNYEHTLNAFAGVLLLAYGIFRLVRSMRILMNK
ncbi:hypothetical protein [Pontibacter sp. G13]|uniref:hypothetical protein n=1 Tax=Pontibacter sp. G13 TaxID=3074898 RepID=UPI00288BC1D7|nr:hypothetical protein [Pontibacter sp. G13]WNJ21155.1 hypothetical protein RJD25_11865 [Pontibacter sp. G13]